MAEMPDPIEIPDRALFKAAEVCELLKVQPYVLRTWEAEFRDLGVARGTSGARVYRREDIERVQRIKHLLLIEGLTLAGVRRKLEEESEPPLEMDTVVAPPLASAARERIGAVKRGLRSLLDLLAAPVVAGPVAAAADEFVLASPAEATGGAERESKQNGPGKASKGASPRRKRSA
jgi:DNA-binding transcriptional MerR regulator